MGISQGRRQLENSETIVNNLITCAHGGGNYLLNIGPKPDGSIPEESVAILQAVGKWTGPNATAIYGTERSNFISTCMPTSRSAETRCMHTLKLAGRHPRGTMAVVLSAAQRDFFWRLSNESKIRSAAGRAAKPVAFTQDDLSLRLTGLPAVAPDQPATVIVIECEGEPVMDRDYVRKNRPRFKAGVS